MAKYSSYGSGTPAQLADVVLVGRTGGTINKNLSVQDLLEATHDALEAVPSWTADATEQSLRSLAESRGLTAGKVFQPLRVALTGLAASPGIFDVLVVLGKTRSLARIDASVRYLATP